MTCITAIFVCRHQEKTPLPAPQIFELWERPGAAGDKPGYYVKCIYNNNDLSLAHHPNGVRLSALITLMALGISQAKLPTALQDEQMPLSSA